VGWRIGGGERGGGGEGTATAELHSLQGTCEDLQQTFQTAGMLADDDKMRGDASEATRREMWRCEEEAEAAACERISKLRAESGSPHINSVIVMMRMQGLGVVGVKCKIRCHLRGAGNYFWNSDPQIYLPPPPPISSKQLNCRNNSRIRHAPCERRPSPRRRRSTATAATRLETRTDRRGAAQELRLLRRTAATSLDCRQHCS
jgi:hypothetical protein